MEGSHYKILVYIVKEHTLNVTYTLLEGIQCEQLCLMVLKQMNIMKYTPITLSNPC